jgi:predicted RNA-binding protein with PIN domain
VPYVVDGNNLMGAARDRRLGLPRLEQDLVRRLAEFAHARRAFLRVVFDGPAERRSGAGQAGRVRVQYSGAGRLADDVIVDLVRADANPSDIVVITSDAALRSRVRAAGGRVMGCSEFARRLAQTATDPDAGHEKPLPGDVEEWERWFRGGQDGPEDGGGGGGGDGGGD